jgi:hypothetical protein
MAWTVAFIIVLTSLGAEALIEDRSVALVKFRYHGKPRVKCVNCRVAGKNYAPELIGDGVACLLEKTGIWDCELPDAVRRFRVSSNHTELVVVADREALREEKWSFHLQSAFWGIFFYATRFLIQFIRGPVSGQLTAHWLRSKTAKKEHIK